MSVHVTRRSGGPAGGHEQVETGGDHAGRLRGGHRCRRAPSTFRHIAETAQRPCGQGLSFNINPRSRHAPAPRISSRQQDSTLFAMLVTARIVGACAPLSPLTTRTRPKPPECVTRRTCDTASHHVRPSSMPSKPAAKMGAKCK